MITAALRLASFCENLKSLRRLIKSRGMRTFSSTSVELLLGGIAALEKVPSPPEGPYRHKVPQVTGPHQGPRTPKSHAVQKRPLCFRLAGFRLRTPEP